MNILSTKVKSVYPVSVLLMMLFGMKNERMWTRTPRARARFAAINKEIVCQSGLWLKCLTSVKKG